MFHEVLDHQVATPTNKRTMQMQVHSVQPESIAAELGIPVGAFVRAVNDRTDLEDLFDYEFEVLSETEISLELELPSGEREILDIEKDFGEDLGLVFTSPIFTPIKTCNNACPFCFIDQQPDGLRPSLYVKDDDYRLSYFNNTYITLTNLTSHDRERIERIRPGPLYVSVHCTVPEIRQRLLMNPKAGEVMQELRWLASLEIPFHAQLVICPSINDGQALTQSLQDLVTLHPYCESVAVVPVGLTDHRSKLPEMTEMTPDVAKDVIARVQVFSEVANLPQFAFVSDEFYIRAEQPLPQYETYGEFPQLDDGVGTGRLLIQEFFEAESQLPMAISPARQYIALTGKLGGMILQPIVQRLNQIDGLFVDLVVVENQFWGQAVTVAGLITAQDIRQTLSKMNLSPYTAVLIPETMLKSGADLFLDGVRVSELANDLGCAFKIVRDPSRAQSLLDVLFQPVAV